MRRSAGLWLTLGTLAINAVPASGSLLAQTAGNAAATGPQLATMKSDLRRLVGANEVYHAKNRRYASDVGTLPGFKVSATVTVVIASATDNGWSATATGSGAPGKSCT